MRFPGPGRGVFGQPPWQRWRAEWPSASAEAWRMLEEIMIQLVDYKRILGEQVWWRDTYTDEIRAYSPQLLEYLQKVFSIVYEAQGVLGQARLTKTKEEMERIIKIGSARIPHIRPSIVE